VKAEVKEKETQPPKPFTEGTLLKAMESAGKSIEDEELRDAMKDSGLGTPATRAATIERLKNVGYIMMQGKRIAITPKGRTAIELIRAAGVELLTSPEMTGQWERRLNEIAKGQASDAAFMEKVKAFAAFIVGKVRTQARAAKTAFEGDAAPASASGRVKRGSGDAAGKRTVRRGAAAAETAAAREPSAVAAAPSVVGDCPRSGCGGRIFMGKKGYGCSNYKTGCGFVIWKASFGKTLTDAQVKALLTKGATGKLKLTDEDGETYEGKLFLADPATGKLSVQR
jgi:DNA topoisomerase-3